MTSTDRLSPSPAERAANSSPAVRRSRIRSLHQAKLILDAARRLVQERGDNFTTQELAKEAGVALQTFYRYFATKDQLLLAVIGELVELGCARIVEKARDLDNPIDRLRLYITSTLDSLDVGSDEVASARFIVSAHWELQRRFPDEIAEAMQPFADLLLTEINAAVDAGLLHPPGAEKSAWFINQLVQSVYHYYAYTSERPPTMHEDLWRFCLVALGGARG